MKIKYEFVTGEALEIDVPDNIGKATIENDKDIWNNNRRETGKHRSLDELAEKGIHLPDLGADIHSIFEQQEMRGALHKALDKLLPQQKELVRKVFFEGRTMADIAREDGVGKSAVQDRFNRIYKKLENILFGN